MKQIAFKLVLLLSLLSMHAGSVWSQVANVSTGVVNSQNYGWLKSSYPNVISVPDLSGWTGDMVSKTGDEHWNGTASSTYYEQQGSDWNASSWSRKMTTTMNLAAGKYVLVGAARASADVSAYMKVGGSQVAMANKGATGKGITTSGLPSFDEGEFANSGNGYGWEYRFIRFEVTAAGDVTIEVGGSTSVANKWMSFTTPQLWKADDATALELTAGMFHAWNSPYGDATVTTASPGCAYNLNTSSDLPYGDGNVNYLNYADLSNYKTLQLVVLEGTPRLLFNRQTDGGNDFLEINAASSSYVRSLNSLWIIDLEKIRDNFGGYVHLNCIKGANYSNVNIKSMTLTRYPSELTSEMFKHWDGVGKTQTVTGTPGMENQIGSAVVAGGTIYGDGNVDKLNYADLSNYNKMVIAYTGSVPRVLFNRQEDGNSYTEVNSAGEYATIEDGLMTIDLTKLHVGSDYFAHLNVIKTPFGGNTTINSIHLYTEEEYADINPFTLGDETNCETHVLYQLDQESGTFIADLAKFKDKILEYFGKSALTDFSNLYLRWYVIDNATNNYFPDQAEILNPVGTTEGDHHKEDVGMLWFGWGTPITDDNCAEVLNANVTLPGKTASDVTMVCVMTDDLSGLAFKHEPTNLKHKIVIRFIRDDWSAISSFDYPMSKGLPAEILKKQVKVASGATTTATGQLQTALQELFGQITSYNGNDTKYLHVYLTNSNGVIIDATKPDNSSLFSNALTFPIQSKGKRGYVWPSGGGTIDFPNLVNAILTKPENISWDKLRVVCDLTDDLTGSYFVGTAIMEEPSNLKARLIVSFKEDNGDTYSATSAELTTGMTIPRKHNSTETAALDLADSEHFNDVNGQFGNHLNDNSNVERLYIRWYLADEDGEWVPTPAGITLSPAYAGYADKVIDERNYGKVLHLGNAGGVVTADMLKMNIQVTDATVDLNDYRVVCALGYADEGYTTEPSPLKAKYTYTFQSPFEGKLAADAIEHTKEVIVTGTDQTNGYVVIPIDDYYSEILSDFDTNAAGLGKNLHIRWYVVHNDERYVRSDLQLAAVNSAIGYKTHDGVSSATDLVDGSIYWNSATSGSTNPEGNLNVKFTIPTTDTQWENYKVVAVLTNNISAESGQVVSGGELTMEPQVLNVQYVFSLIDGVFKFVHHKGASGRDYFTHSDDVNINAPSGDYSMTHTTIFLPTEANVIGGRGDGFFTSDRYTLGSAKQSNIDPATGEAAPEGAKYGGLLVKKDNPTKTAIFKVSGVNSVVGYLTSTNKTESRTCYAKATPTDGSTPVEVSGTSEHEGLTAVITLNLDPSKEYIVDFSDSRKTGTEDGADLSLLGVRFVKDGTEPHVYVPTQFTQYSWNNDKGKAEIAERGDIRQGVHTVEYNVFIKPSDGEKMLKLPFEGYDGSTGNNLEPMAYIRWYDWSSDLGSAHLNRVGAWLKQLDDAAGNRGLFMLNNSKPNQNPIHTRVGVTYDPAGLTADGDIIACDVGKYYDGLYPGFEDDDRADFSGLKYPQFVHEPTLSTRYLFHVYPSSVIVSDIQEGYNRFMSALSGLTTENFTELKKTMFNLYEDNGRVVVSLNGSTGDFAVRAQLQTIGEYYVSGGTEDGVQCTNLRWASYLEDESGLWSKTDGNLTAKEVSGRIYLFNLSSLSGNYSHLTGGLGTKYVEAAPGMRFHIIGYVGNGSTEAAAIHYELQFLNAPAILAENLASTDVKRTSDYLRRNFREGGVVNFDKYFDDLSEPTSEAQNMLFNPLAWKEAQYGFCYPSIDKYRIRTGWSGLTPIHGDYMLLKSIGRPNVSAKGSGDEAPASGCEYVYWWYTYDPTILYDYTHLRNEDKYGGYIYVDASDESRTIATLDFSANLCAGSQIYFTAAIADVTSGDLTSPQLMAHVYAKNEYGEKTQIISFLTSVLNTVNTGDGGYKHNKWYQVYGHGNVPEYIDISNFTDFSVEIDNYSKNTQGADFCVDQIVFYTSTGKMQVEQTGGMCEDENLQATAYMDVEHLEAMVTLSNTPKTLYYKIFKKTGVDENGTISYEPYDDPSVYDNGTNAYGQITVSKYVIDANGELDTTNPNNANYEVRDGILYLKLLNNKVLNLPQGYEYYISMTKNLVTPNLTQWADPNNACEVYSNFFVPRKTFIHFLATDGEHEVVSQIIQGECGDPAKAHKEFYIQTNYPDPQEPSGFKALPYGTDGSLTDDGVLFDYFLGSKEQLVQNYPGYDKSLKTALQEYRQFEREHDFVTVYSTALAAGYNGWGSSDEEKAITSKNYAILKDAIDNGLLLLRASSKFEYDLWETTSFWGIPVNSTYTFDEVDYHICEYIPFTFTVNGGFGTPELTIGFDDVNYEAAGTERVIRVGLEQLNKMRTQGYKLHVPVNMFKDKKGQTAKRVYFPSDSYLTISAVDKTASPTVPNTTDPTPPAVGTKFAKIVAFNGSSDRPYVDKNHMYLALDLSGENCAIDFHEGYQYEVATTFHDEDDDENLENACIGDLFLLIKVVPEFVTWEAQNVDDDGNPTTATTDYWSANWYNDGNWQRSTRDVLYKNTKGSGQNTGTAGHPTGYDNNGEGTLSSLTAGSNPGFVPMKFTYVTLPTGNHAPSLINEPRVVGTGKGARRQGGGFLDLTRTTLLTDRSPNANTDGMSLAERQNSKPTENIYYDMLVRYGEYHTGDDPEEHYGEGCFGHRYIKSDGTWDDQGTQDLTAKVFDVEKFQGNVCREIYFKPGAELLRPHRLQYEKAWVEKELDANKWYLVSAPMKNMYAGDMYVPATAMTDYSLAIPATVVGRQVTEAFQPITFSTPTYSRTNYPIYQRSWGMNNGSVYVQQNDIRANSYSANLKYNGVTTNMAEWGHTFNDVQVPYNTLTAFSIRAHKKDQADKVLIRLPKADTDYKYFRWDDVSSTPAAGSNIENVDKTDIYKLVSDYQDDTDTQTSPLEFYISDMQQQGDYVLVGNPFMVSLDMKKFFETNSALSTDGYWTYEASVAEAHAVPTVAKTTVIKPLQAFFVKKGTATKITFNKEMQIDGNFPTPPGWNDNPAPMLTLSVSNDRGGSTAVVALNDETSADYVGGEDVETLFDSNLSDVPMVYTVADGMAVSINRMPQIGMVPFGVVCNDNVNVNVNVNLNVNVNDNVNDNDNALRSTLHAQPSTLHAQPSTLHAQPSTLYVYDALTGETTEVGEDGTVTIQPNDYGRYFLTSTEIASPVERQSETSVVISVRGGQVTVTATDNLQQVRAVNISGATMYQAADCGTTCQFQLQPATYVIEADSAAGRKTVKVFVR